MARRKKGLAALRRPPASRDPYDRVLVVCEGSKTEPNYLKGLRLDFRINSANLKVIGDGGSAPESVVEKAIEEFEADGDFDSVFCVFDKDEHTGYAAAVVRVNARRLKRSSGGYARFEAITSVPCFEYWLLLHFRDTDAPFIRAGPVSPAENVFREIRKHIPGYEKGSSNAYESTREHLDAAKQRAERVLAQVEARGSDNPSTRVHQLVDYLRRLTQP